MSTARRRATYEDLCAVPEHLVAEIVDGELITSPRPAPRHAVACSAIGAQLRHAFGGPPGGPSRVAPFAAVEIAPRRWWVE